MKIAQVGITNNYYLTKFFTYNNTTKHGKRTATIPLLKKDDDQLGLLSKVTLKSENATRRQEALWLNFYILHHSKWLQ